MPSVRLLRTMAPRDPAEPHRPATPLELFFDLTFVAAVAEASTTMHHLLVDGHAGDALVGYPMVFFAIWWAWMNFTWFASAYDPDDAAYRVAVLVQMAGVLVFAAGVPRFLEDLDTGIVVLGYVIMRVGLIAQWLRAAAQHPEGRACALRYAGGIAVCQVGWVAMAVLRDEIWIPGFAVLALLELAVPAWAEREGRTNWHPGHIGERYGLFTLIVLGESVLAATIAIQTALDEGRASSDLLTTAAGGFLVVAGMWWAYFEQPRDALLARAREAFSAHARDEWTAFLWGYGHYAVFASAAAAGIGIAVAVDQATDHTTLTRLESGLVLTVPVAIYLLTVWILHRSYKPPGPLRTWASPLAAALVLVSSWTAEPVLLSGLTIASLIAASVVVHDRERQPART
jgi:low temperature requirement protein LtrA